MPSTLLARLTRLRLDAFLKADTPEALLKAAYGASAIVAFRSVAHHSRHFAIIKVDGQFHGLWFADDRVSDYDWGTDIARVSIAHDAVYQPHASGTSLMDLIEALVCNDAHEDIPEEWPTGHLLRLLLSTLPEDEAEDLRVWIGLGWPAIAQGMDAQARLVPA